MPSEPRILLVEDDPDLASAERLTLERMGCRVDHAVDGAQAIALLRDTRFDLVCLDLMLPHTFGLEVCEFVRRQPSASATPVLVTSSRALPLDLALAIEAGSNGFLTKPFELREFQKHVRALLTPPERFLWRVS